MSAIEANSLTKRFGSYTAVDQLSFQVDEGEIFGLLGPNGAGKTTTVRMLACVIAPSGGSGTVLGRDLLSGARDIRRSVGILTESPSLYERMNAVENLEFFGKAYGMTDSQELAIRIKEILESFQLWERRSERVSTFSKGMKQKLAIARAIVHNPQVLFLDEPTASLDPESSKLIRDLIESLGRSGMHTVLLCTHRLEDAEKLCSRVLIINRGRSKALGRIDELRSRIAGRARLEVSLKQATPAIVEGARLLQSVEDVEVTDYDTKLLVTAKAGADAQEVTPYVVRTLVEKGAMITGLKISLPSLEETYLKVMKEA